MRRIRRIKPSLVVLSNGTSSLYRVKRGGRKLSRKASRRPLRKGLKRTLRRLKRTGADVAVVRDQARAPFDPPTCVGGSMDDLRECAFKARRSSKDAYDARAARRVKGVRLIDPLDLLCQDGLCPSVIDDMLVYRNDYHLSATFARWMGPWLLGRLPEPRPR